MKQTIPLTFDPCPFCAGTVEYDVSTVQKQGHCHLRKVIHCMTCEFALDVSSLTRAEALEYWNVRPTESALKATVANLRKQLLEARATLNAMPGRRR